MNTLHHSTRISQCATNALSALLLSSLAHGDATFDFNNGTSLDNVEISATMAALDTANSINVTLTSVDIIGQDGSLASDGVQFHTTNITTSSNALGIRDASNPNGAGNNSRDFDPGEGWVFSFDVDVTLTAIDFAGQSAGEDFTISSSAFDDIVLVDGQDSDIHSLLDTDVPAGTEITIQLNVPHVAGLAARITELTVAAVPDTSGGLNLIWAGVDGDSWNSIDPNFTGDDTDFNDGANVDIQTAGVINLDAAGINAGSVSVTADEDTVTLQGGDLTTTSLLKSEASTLTIASPITLSTGTGVTTLSAGTLHLSSGSTLNTGLILLSGGSTLQVDAGAALTTTSGGAISTGGTTLNIESPLTLGSVIGDTISAPLIKTGSEALTLTGDLGTRITGPVDLDILEGSIIAAAGSQLNMSGENTIDGDLILDGGRLELHGSTLSGTGTIIAQSGDATIDSRFQGGLVNVANPITLTSDLFLDAPTNGNSSSELIVSGIISGSGNLNKIGNGLVISSGINTYTGNTTVESGVLNLTTASLADTSTLFINATGVLNLSHTSGDTVSSLIIDDIELSPGTYGSSAVTEITPQNIDDTHFSGDGWLIVTSGPFADDYSLWASGFGLTGGMDDDDDNDGLSNKEEYAFALNPSSGGTTSPFSAPLDKANGLFTFTRRNTTAYDTGLTYSYFYSTDLVTFTPFTPDDIDSDLGNPIETIDIAVPAELLENETLFVQIIAQPVIEAE